MDDNQPKLGGQGTSKAARAIDIFWNSYPAISEWLFRLCEVMLITALFSLAAAQTGDPILRVLSGILFVGTYLHAARPVPTVMRLLFWSGKEKTGPFKWAAIAASLVFVVTMTLTAIYGLRAGLRQILTSGIIN